MAGSLSPWLFSLASFYVGRRRWTERTGRTRGILLLNRKSETNFPFFVFFMTALRGLSEGQGQAALGTPLVGPFTKCGIVFFNRARFLM